MFHANCGSSSWLVVELDMPGMNPDAIGAKITVETADGHVQSRLLLSGGTSYGSGGPPEVHFGLGEHEQVRNLTVHWPDGKVSQFDDFAANQTVNVKRLE